MKTSIILLTIVFLAAVTSASKKTSWKTTKTTTSKTEEVSGKAKSARPHLKGSLTAVVGKFQIDRRVNTKDWTTSYNEEPPPTPVIDVLGNRSGDCSTEELHEYLGDTKDSLAALKELILVAVKHPYMMKTLYTNSVNMCPLLMKTVFKTYSLFTKRFVIVHPMMKNLLSAPRRKKPRKECSFMRNSQYKGYRYHKMLEIVRGKLTNLDPKKGEALCLLPIMASMSYICQYKKLYDAVEKKRPC